MDQPDQLRLTKAVGGNRGPCSRFENNAFVTVRNDTPIRCLGDVELAFVPQHRPCGQVQPILVDIEIDDQVLIRVPCHHKNIGAVATGQRCVARNIQQKIVQGSSGTGGASGLNNLAKFAQVYRQTGQSGFG